MNRFNAYMLTFLLICLFLPSSLYGDEEIYKKMLALAQQGNTGAQLTLGAMYYKGEGVPQDYVNAHMWINLAATQGNLTARKTRDIVAKLMTASQIAEAQHRAREKFAEIQAQREKKEEKQ